MAKILIVEDDKKLREELKIFLEKHGYEAVILEKFDNTIAELLESKADLVLLDINLPYMDGEYICKEIRKVSNVPIIIVTSRDNELDELLSINNGADQYITKPYNIQILLAKIERLLQRSNTSQVNQDKIDCGEFVLNISKSIIEKDDKSIELTKNELKILHYLVLNKGKIVSRNEIMDYLWDSESFVDDNTLTVNIKRLRTKLEEVGLKDLIETKRGLGVYFKMRFKEYLKDKIIYISLLVFAVITIEILLIPYDMQIFIKIYVAVAIIAAFLIGFLVEYYSKKNYYDTVKSRIRELQEEYLIMEVLPKADFTEANILEDAIRDIGKSMLENVNKYKYLQEDYKDFIELWIHEIKIPIATSKMIVENNKNEITASINEELDKIDNYTEQALFYARSNTVEKDYIVRKIQLKEIVNASILKNKAQLIQNKISIDTKNLDETVCTDSKWCIFIINQIIQNSIKYSKNADRQIEIYGERKKENIILYIKDNGIGIKESEITRVFEKGFTGENGRITGKKSTGIGLYLCKKLCDKLCIGLELNSKKDEGTEVKLIFPNNSFINMK